MSKPEQFTNPMDVRNWMNGGNIALNAENLIITDQEIRKTQEKLDTVIAYINDESNDGIFGGLYVSDIDIKRDEEGGFILPGYIKQENGKLTSSGTSTTYYVRMDDLDGVPRTMIQQAYNRSFWKSFDFPDGDASVPTDD